MVITVVCDVFGEVNNGTIIAALHLINHLKKQGHEVRVLCADKSKKGLPGYYVVPNLWFGFIIDRLIVKKNNVTLALPKKKIIKKAFEGADHVHIMMPLALGIKATKVAKGMGLPITAGFHVQAENVTSHLGLYKSKWANHKTYEIFWNKVYQYVDAIHYPTLFIKELFEAEVGHTTNGYIISNGVNDYFKQQVVERKDEFKNCFNILTIGRLSKEKKHTLIIKAASLSKYRDKIQLVFAGQGPRKKEILKEVDKLGIRKPIIRFYRMEDMIDIINSCDLYCHPSECEIEAISCLEAITCGLVPVISNSPRSATNRFALNPNSIFDYKDPKDLANKIDYWIEHPEEKEKISKEYLGFTNQFKLSDCMRRMEEMIVEVDKNHERK